MTNEMENRLIEVIEKYFKEACAEGEGTFSSVGIADALIKEGAILPRFKLGQEVWCIVRQHFRSKFIAKGKICARKYFDNDIGEQWWEYMISRNKEDCDPYDVQEKCIFLTKAEALAAMREGE